MTSVARFAERPARLLVALALACGVVLTSLLLGVRPAYAASEDVVRSLDVDYTVRPDGVMAVKETWVYEFGSDSGRHGMYRYLVTREPYDDDSDAVYAVSGVTVSSPDPGVSADVDQTTTSEQDGRVQDLRLQIGSANQTVSSPTATYVISYQVAGALRSSPNASPPYAELYWDVTGTGNPEFRQISVNAAVPGGPYQGDLTCFAGAVQSTNTCSSTPRISGDAGVFAQSDLPAGENLTIGVKIDPAAVTNAAPNLVTRADAETPAEKAAKVGAGVAGGVATVGAPILGVVYYRRKGRDERWAGLPPGTFPAQGQEPATVPNDPKIPIPVAFVPPKIPVAEGGLLIDGVLDTKETAATLVDLAVRGTLTIISESKRDVRVRLVDPNLASAPHEMQLLNGIFQGSPAGTVVDLGAQGSLLAAKEDMDAAVRQQVAAQHWFTTVPSGRGIRFGGLGIGLVALFFFLFHSSTSTFFTNGFHLGLGAVLIAVAALSIIVTVFVVRAKMTRGQRTPVGRAWCDQVEGFRTYIATAEADQLRFEEGEDIFSRYLPWAVVFGLADRWAKVCRDLVAMGRIPDTTPGWYYGNLNMASFNAGFLTGALTSAATPVPSAGSGSSGTGFGGGSSFGGGGFSGGGGGGGGSGSW